MYTQQLNQLEASIDKKIATAVNLSMNAKEQDVAMEPTSPVDQRVAKLEQQMQHLHATQQGMDLRLGQMHTQMETQAQLLGNTLGTKLTEHMDRIEQMLNKRKLNE